MSRHSYHLIPTEDPREPSNPGDCRIQMNEENIKRKNTTSMYSPHCCHCCYTIFCCKFFMDWIVEPVNAFGRRIFTKRSQSEQSNPWCCFSRLRCWFYGIIEWILNCFRKIQRAPKAKEIEILQSRLHDCENEVVKQKRLNDDLESKIQHLTHDMQVLSTEKNQLERRVLDLQKSLDKEKQKFEEEKKEKEKALTRLSAVAGDKLRVNNPGIADLSDENRPNKLAEKFSELYDNEWTEFYEVLEESKQTEEDIIGNLLQILQETYNTSNSLAENQRRFLRNAILHPANLGSEEEMKPPEGILSKITDLQKQTASLAFENVKKEIMKNSTQITDGMNEAKRKYVERCIQLCWMMAIQDPPMHLDFGPLADSEVDKNVYRMYTKQGEKVDFIVWPAVFLHHQGPLVQKGVLQPK